MKKVIYLAGGCFWGLAHLMQSLPGVTEVVSGYANGSGAEEANYAAVCTGLTGFRETVQVTYDPEAVSLETLLRAYFAVIDPTEINRQGMDIGTQYQTGIYYDDEESRAVVERAAAAEKGKHRRFYGTPPLGEFLPRRGVSSGLFNKESPRLLPHLPCQDGRGTGDGEE